MEHTICNMPTNDDPTVMSIRQLRSALDRRQFSSVELLTAFAGRIQAIDGHLRAFVEVDPERAFAEARSLDAQTSSGRSLSGIPIGVKDVIHAAGFPTRAGSAVLQDAPPSEQDAQVLEKLRDAEAIVVGKTTTHEFAYGVLSPPCRNPWDLSRAPGGSSGGSAAAVAARLVSGAIGTDTGGSIRVPAALCGVTGLQPRPGRGGMDGIIPLVTELDTCGPIARSVSDVSLMWSRMSSGADTSENPDATGPRVFGTPAQFRDVFDLSDDVARRVEESCTILEGDGYERVNVALPHFDEWDEWRTVAIPAQVLAVHMEANWYPARKTLYGPAMSASLEKAEQITAADYRLARKEIDGLAGKVLAAFDRCEFVVLPTVPDIAPMYQERDVSSSPNPRGRELQKYSKITAPVNWCGLAALSVPCGLVDGLPVGLQIISKDEATVLTVGERFQASSDFHELQPPI